MFFSKLYSRKKECKNCRKLMREIGKLKEEIELNKRQSIILRNREEERYRKNYELLVAEISALRLIIEKRDNSNGEPAPLAQRNQ